MDRGAYILRTFVVEYLRYERWIKRTNGHRCPIDMYFQNVCIELNIDINALKEAYEATK